MPRRTPLTSVKRISEINLTPLMDLTFILLITFIITFPLIEQGISVNLPKGKADKLSPDKATTITVKDDGSLYLDNVAFTLEELRKHIERVAAIDPSIVVMVRADERLQYGKVVDVLKILHGAKITKMALVTQGES